MNDVTAFLQLVLTSRHGADAMTVVVLKQVKSQLPLQRLFTRIWPHWLPRADRQAVVEYFRRYREGRSNG